MALMMTTPTTNPMATPSSSTAGQIPMALQHSPSPPPMTRSNSYLRRQQQQQEQQQQQGEVVPARAASSTSTKVSPRSGGTKRRSSGISEAAEASAAAGGAQDTLSEKMTQKDEVRKVSAAAIRRFNVTPECEADHICCPTRTTQRSTPSAGHQTSNSPTICCIQGREGMGEHQLRLLAYNFLLTSGSPCPRCRIVDTPLPTRSREPLLASNQDCLRVIIHCAGAK